MKVHFMNGIEQYEQLLTDNNISIECDKDMDMFISKEDADKLKSLLADQINEGDVIFY